VFINKSWSFTQQAEVPVFLCNRKFLGIPYYTKRH
jgi:hypothetical protein